MQMQRQRQWDLPTAALSAAAAAAAAAAAQHLRVPQGWARPRARAARGRPPPSPPPTPPAPPHQPPLLGGGPARPLCSHRRCRRCRRRSRSRLPSAPAQRGGPGTGPAAGSSSQAPSRWRQGEQAWGRQLDGGRAQREACWLWAGWLALNNRGGMSLGLWEGLRRDSLPPSLSPPLTTGHHHRTLPLPPPPTHRQVALVLQHILQRA
jgi:hypothetical protein